MEPTVQRAVRDRAKNRCEYCRFPEAFAEVPFHVDHIIARQHGGPSELDNLALACCFCNRYKGPNLSGVDAESGLVHSLVATPANAGDATQTQHLLHGKETDVFADAGYSGVHKREEIRRTMRSRRGEAQGRSVRGRDVFAAAGAVGG